MTEKIFTDKRYVCILALFINMLWGSAYPVVKYGYELLSITPADTASQLLFAGVRFFAAGVLLLLFCGLTGKKIFRMHCLDFGRLTLLGLVMTTAQYCFLYIGLSHASGVKSTIINSSAVFFGVIFAHFFFKNEKLRQNVIWGCIIGFFGVAVINQEPSRLNLEFSLLGEGFIVLASIIVAMGDIYGKIISQQMDALLMSAWQMALGGFVLLTLGLAWGGSLGGLTPLSFGLLLYMVLISAVAGSVVAALLKYNPVSTVMVFYFSMPVLGAVLSVALLGENVLQLKNLLALLCVSAGIMLVTRSGPMAKRAA